MIGLGSNLLVADEGFQGARAGTCGASHAWRFAGELLVAGGGARTNAVALHRARRRPPSADSSSPVRFPGDGRRGRAHERRRLRERLGSSSSGRSSLTASAHRRTADELGSATAAPTWSTARSWHASIPAHAAAAEEIKAIVGDLQAQRKAAQPTNKRTYGSVFKNPDHELSAGRMLEACGLKGHRIGGAQISPRHANFIENADGARSADAIALMTEARRRALGGVRGRLQHQVELLGEVDSPPIPS